MQKRGDITLLFLYTTIFHKRLMRQYAIVSIKIITALNSINQGYLFISIYYIFYITKKHSKYIISAIKFLKTLSSFYPFL